MNTVFFKGKSLGVRHTDVVCYVVAPPRGGHGPYTGAVLRRTRGGKARQASDGMTVVSCSGVMTPSVNVWMGMTDASIRAGMT